MASLEHKLLPAYEFDVVRLDVFAALGALAELKGKEREVISMRYVHGLDVSEAASALGLSRQGVRDIERKALEKVRKRLRVG